MVEAPTDSILEDLELLERDLFSHIADQVQALKVELRFLRTFLKYGSAKWRAVASNDANLGSIFMMVEDELTKAGEEFSFAAVFGSSYKHLDHLVPDLMEKVEVSKPKIRDAYMVLSSSKFASKTTCSMTDELLVELADSVLENLKDLLKSDGKLIVSVKEQILAIDETLRFMRNFVAFAANRSTDHEKKEGLLFHVEDIANSAAYLSYSFWLSKKDSRIERSMKSMLSDLLRKVKPSSPEVIEMYVGILKASELSRSEIYMAGEVVIKFVNILLEDCCIQ